MGRVGRAARAARYLAGARRRAARPRAAWRCWSAGRAAASGGGGRPRARPRRARRLRCARASTPTPARGPVDKLLVLRTHHTLIEIQNSKAEFKQNY